VHKKQVSTFTNSAFEIIYYKITHEIAELGTNNIHPRNARNGIILVKSFYSNLYMQISTKYGTLGVCVCEKVPNSAKKHHKNHCNIYWESRKLVALGWSYASVCAKFRNKLNFLNLALFYTRVLRIFRQKTEILSNKIDDHNHKNGLKLGDKMNK